MSLLKAEKACKPADFAFQKSKVIFIIVVFQLRLLNIKNFERGCLK